MRAVIFANGLLNHRPIIKADDLVIAADGGAHHCLELGLNPDIVIGDQDSLSPEQISNLRAIGSKIIHFPTRKDNTDLELALHHALEIGVDQILILAAMGARWDQTIANILLAASISSIEIRLIDDNQELFFVRGGGKVEITGQPGDTVSLIPLTGNAEGISTRNLEYPLENEELLFSSTRGVSNVLLTESATVSLQHGLIMCTVIHL